MNTLKRLTLFAIGWAMASVAAPVQAQYPTEAQVDAQQVVAQNAIDADAPLFVWGGPIQLMIDNQQAANDETWGRYNALMSRYMEAVMFHVMLGTSDPDMEDLITQAFGQALSALWLADGSVMEAQTAFQGAQMEHGRAIEDLDTSHYYQDVLYPNSAMPPMFPDPDPWYLETALWYASAEMYASVWHSNQVDLFISNNTPPNDSVYEWLEGAESMRQNAEGNLDVAEALLDVYYPPPIQAGAPAPPKMNGRHEFVLPSMLA